MTTPIVEYVAEAGQTDFDVPFPFLSPTHVEVRANGIRQYPTEWVNSARLRLGSPPGAGSFVTLTRNTPIEQQLVKFTDGAILTQEDLNAAVQQLLYKQQEIMGLYEGTLHAARVRIGEAGGIAVTPEDAANQIANLVAEQQVLADFRQRIADIEANSIMIASQGETIINHANEIVTAATDRTTLNGLLSSLREDHEALSGVVDALANLEDGTGLASIIQNEQDARIAGDTALAATISLIGAKNGTNSAFILDLNKVKVSPTESLSQRLSAINAKAGSNEALIQAEQTARANAISAEATARTSLAATLRDEQAAAITSEQEARVDGDQAEAEARESLAATLRDETAAAITAEQSARATAISAEATARNSMASTLRGEFNAAINSEATTRANQDGVFAGLFTLLGAKNSAGTAFVLNDSKVQLANGVALGSRLSGIDTAISNTNAAIVNEQTARSTGDQANANAITVVSTKVNGHTSSISSLQSSVNGLSARWGLKLDVNGYISGVVTNNNGSSADFVILADKFRLISPGNTAFAPFQVIDGITYIKKAAIQSLSIGTGQLIDQAVNKVTVVETASAVQVSKGGYVDVLTASVSKSTSSSIMRVTGYIPIFSPDDLKVTAVLYRDGTSISSGTTDFKGDGAGTQVTMTIPAVDTGVSAGSHTYKLRVYNYEPDSIFLTVGSGAILEVVEVKK